MNREMPSWPLIPARVDIPPEDRALLLAGGTLLNDFHQWTIANLPDTAEARQMLAHVAQAALYLGIVVSRRHE